MKRTTQWRPDTCNCVLEYEWDDAEAEDVRRHDYKSVVACDEHSGLKGKEAYDHVLGENTTKNKVHGELLKIPRLREEVPDGDGNPSYQLKPGVTFDWSFDGKDDKRELNVYLKGDSLSVAEKDKLKVVGDKKVNV